MKLQAVHGREIYMTVRKKEPWTSYQSDRYKIKHQILKQITINFIQGKRLMMTLVRLRQNPRICMNMRKIIKTNTKASEVTKFSLAGHQNFI